MVSAERLTAAPIVHAGLDARIGTNINGPSLIRAPSWLPNRLGEYYLYFAHHEGAFIRLAVADDLKGPWRAYSPGVLDVEATRFHHHIASPDVHVDEAGRELLMYFHGLMDREGWVQGTSFATSSDGLAFAPAAELLAPRPYLRAFRWDGRTYGMTMSGVFWRSETGRTPFEPMPWPAERLPTFWEGLELDERGEWPGPLPFRCRHAAVKVYGDRLLVVYSMAGERPERLVYSWVELTDGWERWRGTEPGELLEPELPWEGADLPLEVSSFGAIHERVRELRDPAIFTDENGTDYIVYSGAGEHALGIARLRVRPGPEGPTLTPRRLA